MRLPRSIQERWSRHRSNGYKRGHWAASGHRRIQRDIRFALLDCSNGPNNIQTRQSANIMRLSLTHSRANEHDVKLITRHGDLRYFNSGGHVVCVNAHNVPITCDVACNWWILRGTKALLESGKLEYCSHMQGTYNALH